MKFDFGEFDPADFREAISGNGPRALDWEDKPHRLVFDLLDVVDTLTSERDALKRRVERLEEATRTLSPKTRKEDAE